MRSFTAIALACAVLLVGLPGARATVVVPLDLETLVTRSDVAVRASVLDAETRCTSQGAQLFTFTRMRVLERLKGEPPSELVVRTPGGELGELTQKVHGAPEFAAGDEVVLLLQAVPGQTGLFTVTGFSQGAFRVVADAQLGRAVVRPAGPALLTGGKVTPPAALGPEPADAFLARLRRLASERP